MALATLVGGLVVELVVLPPATPVVDGARRRLRRLALLCLVVLVGTTAGDLVTRAQTMAGGGLPAAIAALPAVLTHTHFGAVWIARFALLALALVLAAGSSRALRVRLARPGARHRAHDDPHRARGGLGRPDAERRHRLGARGRDHGVDRRTDRARSGRAEGGAPVAAGGAQRVHAPLLAPCRLSVSRWWSPPVSTTPGCSSRAPRPS